MSPQSKQRTLVVVVFVIVLVAASQLPLTYWLERLAAWSTAHTVAGPMAYGLFVVVATAVFLPGSVSMMVGGYLFGLTAGMFYAALAIPLGAQCAFFVGRWFGQRWVQQKIAANNKLTMVVSALRQKAFLIILLTRLSLVIPFNVLNYLYGATSVRAATHFAATAVGMLPAIALYVYLGTLTRDLTEIVSGDAAPGGVTIGVAVVGAAGLVLTLGLIHRIATRTLQDQMENHR